MHARRLCPLIFLPLLTAALPASAVHHCFPETIRCGETQRASLDATECFVDEQSYADFYDFAAAAGQDVTVRITSTDFTPKLLLFSPPPALVVTQDGSGSEVRIQRTLEGSGLWRLAATSVDAKKTGLYTISL